MSIKCILGLVACLNYHGSSISEQDSESILESCEDIKSIPVREFVYSGAESIYGDGAVRADLLYDAGLRFHYPDHPTPEQKKSTVLKACSEFKAIYSNDANWKNLTK